MSNQGATAPICDMPVHMTYQTTTALAKVPT